MGDWILGFDLLFYGMIFVVWLIEALKEWRKK